MALRYDTVRVDKVDRLASGGLRVPGVLTRVGVFAYQDGAGRTVREYRPPEEVFHADSVQSLRDVAVTVGHPKGKVTPSNWDKLAVGHVSGVPARDDATRGLASDIVVTRGDAVAKVDKRELLDLSGGYEVEIDPTPGVTPEGEAYDVVQRKIRYNHVALLRRGDGRQGTSVGLRLDSKGDETCADSTACNDGVAAMKIQFKFDGKTHEVEAGSAEHLALLDRADAARDAQIADLTSKLAAADKVIAEHTARADAAAAVAKAEARTALEVEARKVLGAEAKFDGKDDRAVMTEALTKVDPEFKADGRSDDYVRARLDIAVATVTATPPKAKTPAQLLVNPPKTQPKAKADSADGPPDIATDPHGYAEYMTRQATNAWRKPAPRNV